MSALLFLAAVSADLDVLDDAVRRCDRKVSNPVFAAEAARRAQFLVDAYREQEAIVEDRLAVADKRRELRENNGTGAKSADIKSAEKQLDLQDANLEDRQKALNDK